MKLSIFVATVGLQLLVLMPMYNVEGRSTAEPNCAVQKTTLQTRMWEVWLEYVKNEAPPSKVIYEYKSSRKPWICTEDHKKSGLPAWRNATLELVDIVSFSVTAEGSGFSINLKCKFEVRAYMKTWAIVREYRETFTRLVDVKFKTGTDNSDANRITEEMPSDRVTGGCINFENAFEPGVTDLKNKIKSTMKGYFETSIGEKTVNPVSKKNIGCSKERMETIILYVDLILVFFRKSGKIPGFERTESFKFFCDESTRSTFDRGSFTEIVDSETPHWNPSKKSIVVSITLEVYVRATIDGIFHETTERRQLQISVAVSPSATLEHRNVHNRPATASHLTEGDKPETDQTPNSRSAKCTKKNFVLSIVKYTGELLTKFIESNIADY